MSIPEGSILQLALQSQGEKLAELERNVDDIRAIQGGYLELYKELEEKLNNSHPVVLEGRLNQQQKKLWELRERLDKLSDDLADHVWDGSVAQLAIANQRKLDALEAAYTDDPLIERVDKLEGMIETILAVHGVKK